MRVDRGIESGSVVSPAYDSLVAKLMAHGEDRAGSRRPAVAGAAARSSSTASRPTASCLAAVLDDGAFRLGEADIHYLEGRPDLRDAALPDEVRRRHGRGRVRLCWTSGAARSLVPVPAAGWRNVGTALHADDLTDAVGEIEVRVPTPAGAVAVLVGRRVAGRGHGDGPRDGDVDLVATTGCDAATGCAARRRTPRYVNGPEGQSTFALRSRGRRRPSGAAWPASAGRRCPGP